MCRLSSEIFVAAGGGSALATAATFAKVHWDAIRDRKAFKAAKKREQVVEEQLADVKVSGNSD